MHKNNNENLDNFIERNNFRALVALLRDWIGICGIVYISVQFDNIFVYFISIWLIGAFQFGLTEGLIHEAVHYNLFKIKKLNNALVFLYVYPFFNNLSLYRQEHLDHHLKISLGSKEEHTHQNFDKWGLNDTRKNMFWLFFIKPLMGWGAYSLIKSIAYKDAQSRDILKLALFWLGVMLLFYYFNYFDILIFYWFIPLFWCCGSLFYWSEITDHYNTKSGTRTNLGLLINFFSHNAGYHSIHHKYPSIPWYKLPQAHKVWEKNCEDITLGFFNTYRQIRKSI